MLVIKPGKHVEIDAYKFTCKVCECEYLATVYEMDTDHSINTISKADCPTCNFTNILIRVQDIEPVKVHINKVPDKPKLVNLEDYNEARMHDTPRITTRPSGVACPDCGSELIKDMTMMLTSSPPQRIARCANGHEHYMRC